jgi:hypothetical protein
LPEIALVADICMEDGCTDSAQYASFSMMLYVEKLCYDAATLLAVVEEQ